MAARRSVAQGALLLCLLSLVGYGTYHLIRPGEPKPSSLVSQVDPKVRVSPLESVKLEKLQKGESGVKLSTRLLDFGRVPLRFPASRTLFLLNQAGARVRAGGIRLQPPFATDTATLDLEPRVATGLAVTFEPRSPGVYEQHVILALGEPVDQEIVVVVRGEGILSPLDAGVPIPPPPDLAARQQREREIARLDAEARSRELREGAGPDRGEVGEPTEGGDAGEAEAKEGDVPAPGGSDSGIPPAVLAAFGLVQSRAEDLNNVPVPIPEGDKKPDLPPPAKDEPQKGESGPGQKDGPKQSPDEPDDEDKLAEEKAGGDSQSSQERKTPTFTVAANSSVLVYSSRETLHPQVFPVRVSQDGSAFLLDGRIKFPELAMAFGKTVGVKQFDNIVGALSPDGQIQMKLILRLDDSGGVVLDLPVTLTTRMAVGYSAEGRVMFATGIPRDPSTGDVKLVGITNIPLGVGSVLDKAPVYVEILGRLTL